MDFNNLYDEQEGNVMSHGCKGTNEVHHKFLLISLISCNFDPV